MTEVNRWNLRKMVFTVLASGLLASVFSTDLAIAEGERVGFPRWDLVYEHDENGEPVAGDLNTLIEAVKSGADVKVGIRTRSGGGIEYEAFYPCQFTYVTYDGPNVVGVNTSNISGMVTGDDFGFFDDAYHYFGMFKTTGEFDESRWSVGEHVDRGHTRVHVAMKWFVKR